MNELRGACIIGQSGGPTSVINASAYGVIDTALKSGVITKVLGAEHGIKGVLEDRLFDMGITPGAEVYLRKKAPLGDPIEIAIRGYELTLRKAEAAHVEVKEC